MVRLVKSNAFLVSPTWLSRLRIEFLVSQAAVGDRRKNQPSLKRLITVCVHLVRKAIVLQMLRRTQSVPDLWVSANQRRLKIIRPEEYMTGPA
jgi:hypothetical protein